MVRVKPVKDDSAEELWNRRVEALEMLGIEPDIKVRFRKDVNSNWLYGKVVLVEDDGSVRVRDKDGRARSVWAHDMQFKVKRKRKGSKWVDHGDLETQTTLIKETK